jgi:hypothetical protein
MTTLVSSLAFTAAITIVVFAGFAVSIASRMRSARERLPGALLIPVVVGTDLARASAHLAKASGDRSPKLRWSSYATIAVDATGLHFVTWPGSEWGIVPASQVVVAGPRKSIVGARMVDAIALRVDSSSRCGRTIPRSHETARQPVPRPEAKRAWRCYRSDRICASWRAR